MTREYCDRCGREVTGKKSGSFHGVADADADGNGNVTDRFDILCMRCYRAVVAFITTAEKSR